MLRLVLFILILFSLSAVAQESKTNIDSLAKNSSIVEDIETIKRRVLDNLKKDDANWGEDAQYNILQAINRREDTKNKVLYPFYLSSKEIRALGYISAWQRTYSDLYPKGHFGNIIYSPSEYDPKWYSYTGLLYFLLDYTIH